MQKSKIKSLVYLFSLQNAARYYYFQVKGIFEFCDGQTLIHIYLTLSTENRSKTTFETIL